MPDEGPLGMNFGLSSTTFASMLSGLPPTTFSRDSALPVETSANVRRTAIGSADATGRSPGRAGVPPHGS
jgi:hypothetical protein